MSDPWFKFFPSDWMSGVSGLSAAERGVYVTLLAMMYDHGAPIKRDDGRLARACGLPKFGFSRAVEALIGEGKIKFEDGFLFNERAKTQLTERDFRSVKASESAKSRWDKTFKNQSCENADALQEQCEPNATRARLPEARVIKQERKKEKGASPPKRTDDQTPMEILRGGLSEQTAADVIAHRKAKRSPLTPRAARLLIENFKSSGDAERAAQTMILRGWTAFKPEWDRAESRAGPGINGVSTAEQGRRFIPAI